MVTWVLGPEAVGPGLLRGVQRDFKGKQKCGAKVVCSVLNPVDVFEPRWCESNQHFSRFPVTFDVLLIGSCLAEAR